MKTNIITFEKLMELNAIEYVFSRFKSLGVESISADEYCLNLDNIHRHWFIENFDLKPESLHLLAEDTSIFIKMAVANHPNTSIETLVLMSKDGTGAIRAEVASNPNTPIYILELLLNDSYWIVRTTAEKQIKMRK